MVDETESCGTREGHIGLKRWDRNNRSDCRLEALVDALLTHCGDALSTATTDVRESIPAIKASVLAMKDRPLPLLTPASSMEGYFEEYPVRKNAEVCSFFAQCGYCKYASFCWSQLCGMIAVKSPKDIPALILFLQQRVVSYCPCMRACGLWSVLTPLSRIVQARIPVA